MARAYLLVEAGPTAGGSLLPRLRSLSLGNCLLLAEELMPGEIVAHLQCNERADVTRAVVEDITRLDGVERTTLLVLLDEG